jgi:hypothetical protein
MIRMGTQTYAGGARLAAQSNSDFVIPPAGPSPNRPSNFPRGLGPTELD